MAPGTVKTREFAHLRLERPAAGVVLVRLDNPTQRNAMSDEMTDSWSRAMGSIAADETVRAVVVTGEGSAFCAGGSLAWLADSTGSVEELRARLVGFYRAWLSVREVPVPTIAAINGAAVGAGLAIALACDIRYAADDAPLSMPFVKLGLHPGMASTHLLPDVVGAAAARDLLLTGRIVRGEEALRLGLVSRLFAADTLVAGAVAAAVEIAAAGPLAVRLTKQTLMNPNFDAGLAREADVQPITMATADFAEGVAAAQQRRSPRFSGT